MGGHYIAETPRVYGKACFLRQNWRRLKEYQIKKFFLNIRYENVEEECLIQM